MHPAFSVIFFTVASGAGFGRFSLLFVADIFRLGGGFSQDQLVAGGLIAMGLVVFGLMSSTFHLANPKNSWRAVSRFRTSKTLLEALRIKPDLEAQVTLGGVEIQGSRLDEAQKLAKQVQQQKPNSPAGFVLEGDTAFARKDYPAALAAFERAYKLEPSGALLVRQLQVFNATQRIEEGEKRLANWLATHPQDASIRAGLAESLIKRKQYAAAAEQYLMLNESNPGNLLILNNLAWALSEMNDKRALSFAEQALKLSPDNAAVLDTYGWLQVRKGDAAESMVIELYSK